METIETLAGRYGESGRISFGPCVALVGGTLHLPGGNLPLNTLQKLARDAGGNAVVRQIGSDGPPIVVPAAEVEDVDQFIAVTNEIIQAIPYLQRRSITGWPPGSIGDVSVRIGTDVRELLIAGYSHEQIRGLEDGEYTLDELYQQRPKGKRMTLRGKR